MRNEHAWRPSKFVQGPNQSLIASRNRADVAAGSRVIGDAIGRAYATYLRQYARGRLVDLGCGQVPLYGSYREHVSLSVCVDWHQNVHTNNHVDVISDLNQPLPFGDRAFNTIVLSDVLEHVRLPHQLWSEMARLLVPGGAVLISVPFYYRIHEAPHDYFRYTEHALRYLAEASGFHIQVLEPLGGSPEVLSDIIGKHLQQIPVIGGSCAAVLYYMTAAILRTRPGRKLSARTAKRFPLGYFLVGERN